MVDKAQEYYTALHEIIIVTINAACWICYFSWYENLMILTLAAITIIIIFY